MNEGNHPGKVRPWFRRRWFKAGLLLVALPFVLIFLSNAWLALPSGRQWVAGKITSRIGFETRIEGSSWSPWGGVRVTGLVIEQPEVLRATLHEPLFQAESIRVWPEWQAWLRKRLEVLSIEVDSPRAVVPIELMARLAGPARIVIAPPPEVAAQAPVTGPLEAETPMLPVAPPAPPQPPVPPVETVAAPPPIPTAPPKPTGWIHVRHGSLAIVSAGRVQSLFETQDFNADLPAAGDPAESIARLAEIRFLGTPLASHLEVPVRWENPFIVVGPLAGEIDGVPYRFAAKMARFGNLPVVIELDVPHTTNASFALPNGGRASAKDFRAIGRFGGLLTAPSTWQGSFVIEGLGLSATLPPRPEFNFDKGGAIVVLRGGVLSCTDARLIGDDLSLLGNATVLSDSRGAAVLRIVTSQDKAQEIANGIGRATGRRMAFGTLGTPDRYASDLYALGNLDGVNIQLGQGGDVVDGPTLLSSLKAKSAESQ